MIGQTISHYRILEKLGGGGMGVVYEAEDLKLGRHVAIKVLTDEFINDAERLARLQREAKMLASLNHPNIAAIYGLEDSEGQNYVVMELVPGETLAERIKREGALRVDDALSISVQIAEALEAAHEKGIIHRDLKPANVKVTPEGKVKVLDFGLAKAFAGDAASEDPSNSPTLSLAATMHGAILGTAAYMSPEQARGKAVDKRTDIWAFGCVLYELLTGQEAFRGEDITDILAAVVRAEPDWNRLPDNTPLSIRTLLRRCLQKDKTLRMRDAGDARIEIHEALGAPNDAVVAHAVVTRRQSLPWIAAAVLLFALAGLAFVQLREAPPAAPVLHLSVTLPGNAPAGFVALSPEGRRLVISFVGEGKSQIQLWLRPLDSPQLQPMPGTDSARAPFWSPDGKSIGFFADGKLKTMPATGGPPQALCDGTGTGASGTWNRDGVILFSTSGVADPLQRVNASGGPCTAVTKPEGQSSHVDPEFLPDGKHFVYVVRRGDEAKQGLYVASLDNTAPRRLLADLSSAVFAPSTTGKKYGYLLFLRGSTLMAQPFSAVTLQLGGDVFPVAAEAAFSFNAPLIAASASSGGTLVYASNLGITSYQPTWLDGSGKELGKVGTLQDYRHVALSPDGKTAATVRASQGIGGIWLYDVERGGETRFTSPALPGSAAVWSPDGKWIAFSSGKGLYLKDASGGLKEELLLESTNTKAPSDWSQDGRYLIYTETDPKSRGDIWFLTDPLNKSSERRPVKFQGTEAMESQGQLSPDGHWLAYVSDESGREEVYVRPFPSGAGRWKVSTGPERSREPRWRRDGKELLFLEGIFPRNRLMAVAVRSGPHGDFQAGTPRALFEFRAIPTVSTANHFLYSPSADGQRFLVNVQAGDSQPTLNVISNWEKAALGNK